MHYDGRRVERQHKRSDAPFVEEMPVVVRLGMSNEMLEQQVQAANTANRSNRNHRDCCHGNRGRDAKEAEDTQQRPPGSKFTDG
jgi:hypothetical protein